MVKIYLGIYHENPELVYWSFKQKEMKHFDECVHLIVQKNQIVYISNNDEKIDISILKKSQVNVKFIWQDIIGEHLDDYEENHEKKLTLKALKEMMKSSQVDNDSASQMGLFIWNGKDFKVYQGFGEDFLSEYVKDD